MQVADCLVVGSKGYCSVQSSLCSDWVSVAVTSFHNFDSALRQVAGQVGEHNMVSKVLVR